MSAESENIRDTFANQLATFDDRLQSTANDVDMLTDIREGIGSLLSQNDGSEAEKGDEGACLAHGRDHRPRRPTLQERAAVSLETATGVRRRGIRSVFHSYSADRRGVASRRIDRAVEP